MANAVAVGARRWLMSCVDAVAKTDAVADIPMMFVMMLADVTCRACRVC